jgi:NAD(P)-dependent dehydrogenase (short-subunit alcohol dehydrogenase family)
MVSTTASKKAALVTGASSGMGKAFAYDAHYRSMSSDVHVALTSLCTGVDKHHYFTHIDWQSNHAATADIVGVLGRALQ